MSSGNFVFGDLLTQELTSDRLLREQFARSNRTCDRVDSTCVHKVIGSNREREIGSVSSCVRLRLLLTELKVITRQYFVQKRYLYPMDTFCRHFEVVELGWSDFKFNEHVIGASYSHCHPIDGRFVIENVTNVYENFHFHIFKCGQPNLLFWKNYIQFIEHVFLLIVIITDHQLTRSLLFKLF